MNISKNKTEELTGFQEASAYNSNIDLRTDFVMPYGFDEGILDRLATWKEKGYQLHLMTGISWGGYQDYLLGKYDGTEHLDEGQKSADGTDIVHGYMTPYMVPTIDFSNYMVDRLKPVIDAGVLAIHLEEPEFWMGAGYSDAFKREWELYYKEPWIAPNSSPDAQFRASKLKAYLYTRMLDRVCSSLKAYAKKKYDRVVRFYVPTHSLVNYANWGIISPESNLIDLASVDGYIAQIWTGTSRTANYYEGVFKERTFETAYLEYGVMQELTRGTGRRMWFLHDPIEDNPRYTWEDYRYNYHKTLVASLLHSSVYHYEICPWPNRVYNAKYPVKAEDAKPIPKSYAAELNIIANVLRDMKQEEVAVEGNESNIGVFIADSAMYQRMDFRNDRKDAYEYNDFSGFFGLAFPLLKHGLPIRPVQLDNVRRFPAYLEDYKIIVMSYEFIKPEHPDVHNAIAQWVAAGGVLVYVGDGSDLYHTVKSWWNQGKKRYADPSQHLLEAMEKKRPKEITDPSRGEAEANLYRVGKGILAVYQESPWEIARNESKAETYRSVVRKAMKASVTNKLSWKPANHFVLRRGPYVIGACLDEAVSKKPVTLKGLFVDLLQHNLPVKKRVVLKPDENCLLYDITKAPLDEAVEVDVGTKSKFHIYPLAGSCRISYEGDFSALYPAAEVAYWAEGPTNVPGIIRFAYQEGYKPVKCSLVQGKKEKELKIKVHEESKTFTVEFTNVPEGIGLIFEV